MEAAASISFSTMADLFFLDGDWEVVVEVEEVKRLSGIVDMESFPLQACSYYASFD